MSSIEASVTLNLPDNANYQEYINMIRSVLTNITGKDTDVHVTEMDDPFSTSTVGPR